MDDNGGPDAQVTIPVVGAVLVRDGLILAAQRGPDMAMPGLWEFPGGKVEAGEDPAAALRRELAEELLCTAQVGEHLVTTEYEYDVGTVVLATYRCRLLAGEPRLTEHSEIRWLTPAELDTVTWAPADLPTVELLRQTASLL